MKTIERATPDQAERLFDIQVRATEVGCAPFYPAEVMAVWHKGRSAEGMAGFIPDAQVHALVDEGVVRGFVHFEEAEVVGLFIDPNDQRKGYGTELFHFAVDKIAARPILIRATLNAVPFYARLGCRKVAIESVRRHDHDIYVQRMEFVSVDY